MGKKRQRPSSAVNQAEFPWKKVDVGLLAPSRAAASVKSSEKDDEDFESGIGNHYDNPSSSAFRSAERDLEAQPSEGVGFFFGLEVLDGSQYDIVDDGGNKRIVPKSSTNTSNEKKERKAKKEKKAKVVPESKSESNEMDTSKEIEPIESTEKTDGTEMAPPKKKKKKNKKKKKASPDTSNGESNDSNASGANTATAEKKEVTKPQVEHTEADKTAQESIGSEEVDSEVESMQNAWLMATGGVTLHGTLCKSLLEQNFWSPTPIQSAALPPALLGKRNIVGAAPTGSGKTLAYLLPIFQFLLEREERSSEERKLQALILAPTRELALQVQGECNKLVKGKCGILVGGLATQKQERVLRKNRPPIIIATPGRLWELISSREHEHLNDLSRLAFLVIDECDRMTEQGSFPQLHRILDAVEKANPMDDSDDEGDNSDLEDDMDDDYPDRLLSLPGVRGEAKTVRLNEELLAMIEKQKNDAPPEPVEVDHEELEEDDQMEPSSDEDEISLPGPAPVQRQTFVYSATLTLPPSASYIPSRNKRKKMHSLKGIEGAIAEILEKARAKGQTKVIDLSNSKKQAKFNEKILESKDKKSKVASEPETRRTFNLPPGLKLQEIQCTQMHKDSHLYAYLVTTKEGSAGPCLVFCNSIKGVKRVGNTLKALGLPVRMLHAQMQQRARFRSVESLQSDSRAVVVATDVAARGLDIPNVASVVHYDVVRKVDAFVHRAGRTARGMGDKAVGSSLSLVSPAEDKAHRKITSELNADFYRVNLDSRLLASAQERANLASKIIAAEKIEGKAQRDNQWFLKSAEDAGLDIDGDLLDSGLAGGNLKQQQQLREAQRAKGVLKRLLAEPMVKQRYGKFLSSNAAASKPEVAPFVVQAQNNGSKKKRRKT